MLKVQTDNSNVWTVEIEFNFCLLFWRATTRSNLIEWREQTLATLLCCIWVPSTLLHRYSFSSPLICTRSPQSNKGSPWSRHYFVHFTRFCMRQEFVIRRSTHWFASTTGRHVYMYSILDTVVIKMAYPHNFPEHRGQHESQPRGF